MRIECMGLLIALLVVSGCSGPRLDPAAALPEMEPAQVERLLRACVVTIEFENKPICLGTIVLQNGHQCLLLTASDRLAADEGYVINQWVSDANGQRFERRRIENVRVVKREEVQDLAVLSYDGELPSELIPHVPVLSTMTTQTAFVSWSAKPMPLRPVDMQQVEVVARQPAQDFQGRVTSYWRLTHGIESQMLGAPMLDKSGRLIGVAVKDSLGIGLYCDDRELRKVIDALPTARPGDVFTTGDEFTK